jgi:phenylacetate-CoA ligase
LKLFQEFDEFLVGRIAFPLVNSLLNRRQIFRHHRELLESETLPPERIQEIQLQRFKHLLHYAYNWCPYYKKKLSAAGIAPDAIHSLEDVGRIPPLERREIVEHHVDMVDVRHRSSISVADKSGRPPGVPVLGLFRRHKLIRNTSTGSTGIPTIFYEDGTTSALNWARELQLKSWFGLGVGVKEARFARVSTEYLPKSKMLRARKRLWNQLILPGMNLSDSDYDFSLHEILRFRPRILWGITTALTGFAEHIRRSQMSLDSWHPDLVITWAAPMYEHEEQLLGEVFECPVTNVYGTREVGHVAARCPAFSLHVNQGDFLVEIEQSGPAEKSGEILVTALHPSPMPFIRYRVGDLGELSSSHCSCGRTLQVLRHVLGRTNEVLHTSDGRMLAPNFWCRVFMLDLTSRAVERFQVVYRKDQSIRIRIVPKQNYSPNTESFLKDLLEKNLGASTHFEFEYVPEIPPHPTGKYHLVVNERF